jgi:hypothetical protein
MNHQENNKDRIPPIAFETANSFLLKEKNAGIGTDRDQIPANNVEDVGDVSDNEK